MNIVAILLAAVVIVFGFRLVTIALQSAFSGKVLVRRGIRSEWQATPTRNDAWKLAARDGLMGILLIVLGVLLIM
jgi:uncharacterized membrane protein HdeD (DUF308 family)